MRFDQAGDDIAPPARCLGAGGAEHGIGFSDARRSAEKNLQVAPAFFLGQGKECVG
jgi:hypothetical protein